MPFRGALDHWQAAGIDGKTGSEINVFLNLLAGLFPLLTSPSPDTVGSRLTRFMEQIGYKKHIEKYSPNALVATNRWKIIEIFSAILDRFVTRSSQTETAILDFIDAMELKDTLDEKKQDEDRVQLLTLHACKGLEFPVVIFMGVEEDIIPHKTLGTDVSEERRLFYVGITRAKKKILFTRTERRQRHGKVVNAPPSRFLLEIPEHLIQKRGTERKFAQDRRRSMLDELYKKLEGSPS
jgi:DNA helicase-2/ATP-dependent DNA helicase PcrA